MRILLCLPVAALVATALPAQPDHFTSSPFGYESVEGGTSVDLIGKEAMLRFQQIDNTNSGSKADRNRIALRRDGLLPDNPAYGARNVEIEVVMAEADFNSLSTTFDSNYVSGTNQMVHTKKTVNFPDWTLAPATAPAGHDLVLFLDNQHSYLGTAATGNAWVIEFRVYSNDNAGNSYPMDADAVVPTEIYGPVTSTGAGCQNSGFSRAMSNHLNIINDGSSYRMELDTTNSAPGNPAWSILSPSLQQTVLPGYCSNLEVNPVGINIFMGWTTGSGFAGVNFDDIPLGVFNVGDTLHAQAVVSDSEQPFGIGLSNARSTTIPAAPTGTSQAVYMYSLNPSDAVATSGIVNGGLIIHTNHP